MPRYFSQASQNTHNNRVETKKKAFTDPLAVNSQMRPTKEAATPAALVQEALAQMESNAAAAMAKFKSFSRPAASPKTNAAEVMDKVEEEVVTSPTGRQDSVKGKNCQESPTASQEVELQSKASKLAVLEEAATRYLQGHTHKRHPPWHHQLCGTRLEFVSNLIDRPLALLAVSLACLSVGLWDWISSFLLSLLSIQRLSLIVGILCLLLVTSGWILQCVEGVRAHMQALSETVPKMPQACDEMGQMLTEMKLMRVDLKMMKAKVAWLPGGE